MTRWLGVIIGVAMLGWAVSPVWANTPVTADQGAPGKQGAWPVSLSGGGVVITWDGGASVLGSVFPAPCTALVMTNDAGIGTSPLRVPVNGGTTGRIWIRICNSILNSSSTQCICRTDGCPGSVAAGVAGDPIATGDCVTYNMGTQDAGVPCCVCNGAGSFLPATECVP